ncbi:hypothetical protein QPK87_25110 [Kamptonema cortianum]|nr:hypothetical protein [Kamptonema cortianum]
MTSIGRRFAIVLTIACLVIFTELALAGSMKDNRPFPITAAFQEVPFNPEISRPKDLNPTNPSSLEERGILEFAWKDFIALNWPVDCQGNSLSYTDPLTRKPLTQIIGQAPEAPRSWELYPSPNDVFLKDGATPPPLDRIPEVVQCLNDRAGSEIQYRQDLRLTETGILVGQEEFDEAKRAKSDNLLDGYGELLPGISLADIDAANHVPLVDRKSNYVINEIRLNPVEFNQIVNHKWFDANNLLPFQDSGATQSFQLACSEGGSESSRSYCTDYDSTGAIEIKAVWRVFDAQDTEPEKARYYTTRRKIVGQNGEILKTQAELGLIGFHIMHKTSKQGWIWATFEQVDNAPPCNEPDAKVYTLYNQNCSGENCQQNWPNVKAPYLWHINDWESKAVTLDGVAVKNQIPSQVCRINPIRRTVSDENKIWQKKLRDVSQSSVWQHYQLVGTQWLRSPNIPYTSAGADRRQITPVNPPLTNVALEPYAQRVSCIVCHTAARLPGKDKACQLNESNVNCADFSFLMDNAQFSQPVSIQSH